MLYRRGWLLPLLVLVPFGCHFQPRLPAPDGPPEYVTDPNSILRLWNCLGAHKNVTREYPTDYRIDGIYRLLQDVIVTHGDTASLVTKYWVQEREPERGAPLTANRTLLSAGTRLRFEEIWLEGNCETGIYVHPYATVLDGPLQGKLLGIGFITDRDTVPGTRQDRCHVNPKYLEFAAD